MSIRNHARKLLNLGLESKWWGKSPSIVIGFKGTKCQSRRRREGFFKEPQNSWLSYTKKS